MTMVRVWNVTDDARTAVVPHTRMVLGKVIKPGRSVLVDAERLDRATKVKKEVVAGLLFIGEKLPAGYVSQKKPPRATVDARVVDSRGKPTGEKVKVASGHGAATASTEKKVVVSLVDEVPRVVDSVEVTTASPETTTFSETSEETHEESGRNRRHRR